MPLSPTAPTTTFEHTVDGNPTPVDLIVSARWLLPIEPLGLVIEHGAIAIDNGIIKGVGTAADIQARFTGTRSQHLATHMLMPGLINAHGHCAMTLLRGVAEDRPLHDWLEQTIWPLERALVSPEFVHDGMYVAAAEMLRGGTTCFADQYFYPEHTVSVLDKAGLRAVLAAPILDFAMPGCANGFEAIDKVLALHDDLHGRSRLQAAFGPHAPYTVSDELLKRVAMLANETGIGVHMHVHESQFEIDDSMQKYGMRPLTRLQKLGLLSPQFLAIHTVHLNDDDIALLRDHGVSAVHCPESNLKLANGFMPVQKCLDAGVNVALGTDGAASNNDLDMFGELRTATLLTKAVAQTPTAGRAHDMLRMATLSGAQALGLEDICGSLKAGKAADMIAVDLSALELQPVHDPIAHLLYCIQRQHVAEVWVDGIALLHRGDLLTLDSELVRARAAHWQARVQEKLKSSV